MIALRRCGEEWVFLCCPVEVTTIHNNATEGCSMTADPLCCRVYGHMCTPLERTEEVTSHTECVVHHDTDAFALSELCDRLVIRNVECRVSKVLEIDCLGSAVDQRLEVFNLVALCKTDLDAHVAESDCEHCECTSIKERLSDDVVTRATDVCD